MFEWWLAVVIILCANCKISSNQTEIEENLFANCTHTELAKTATKQIPAAEDY